MLEILVILGAAFTLLARHGKSRRRGRVIKGDVDEELPLATLGDNTLVSSDLANTVNEKTFILSFESTWSIQALTPGQGPIVVGIAHSDYTDGEIQEWVTNSGSWDEGNLVAQEQGRRKIRLVGTFSGEVADETLNDGKPIKTTCKFMLLQGQTLSVWAFNKSGAALTTGAIVIAQGHAWLKPQ